MLEATQDEVVKQVFVRDGNVVHATSTDRGDSLGSYLQRTGRLTEKQFVSTMEARQGAAKRYGELLVENDLISPGELFDAIRKQIESIVWSLFYWQHGEVRFRLGSFETRSGVRIQIPMRQVVLQGIKRAPNAKALIGRLGNKETVFEPSFRTEDLIQAGLSQEEHELLRLVDGQRTLYEICTDGPLSAADNAKVVYAFYVLRLVRRSTEAGAEVEEAAEAPATAADAGERKAIKIRFKTAGDRFSG